MNTIKRRVNKEDIVNCPVTYEGSNYSAITHKQIIDTINEYLYRNNFRIKEEKYLAASNGQRLIGRFMLEYPDQSCGYELSFKNSLDGSMSFGCASGAYTFICSNGSVWGDISSYKRKHSGNANSQILEEISNTMNLMEETMKKHIERRDKMKEIEISKKVIAELSGRLFIEDEIITSTQLGIIKKEVENPSFNYNSEGSLWEFYSHCTNAIKETTPLLWHNTHKNLSNFFVKEFELV